MRIRLISVPCHMGRAGVGMGAGPRRLLAGGAVQVLRGRGHEVRQDAVRAPPPGDHEIGAILRVNRSLAGSVRRAVTAGELPLVLAGDCNSSLGTLAGLGSAGLGIVWLDAHGDFNTPETSSSGNFDGMALSVATGGCWTRAASEVAGFMAVPEDRVVLAAVRDLDPGEGPRVERSGIATVPAARLREAGVRDALVPALDRLGSRVRGVYLHVDLDALDPSDGAPNRWAAPGGPSLGDVEEMVELVGERMALRAAALTAYDPACDLDGKALASGLRILSAIADAARPRQSRSPCLDDEARSRRLP